MASDVKVVINLAKPVTSAGFGYPLIFAGKSTTAIPYTICSGINDVITTVGGILPSDSSETVATKTAAAMQSPIYKAALLMLMQKSAPSQFAIMQSENTAVTALGSMLYEGWRQLIVVSVGTESESTAQEISKFIEASGTKMYFTSVAETGELTITGNERTVVLCHKDADESVVFPEAALVGATSGKPAGSVNYKNQILTGLTPDILSESELSTIEDGKAIAFVLKAGQGVTSNGKTTSGEYIDIVDSKDYIIQNIEYQTQLVLNQNDKVPYDNNGISMLENVCVNVLRTAANNGMIATTDEGSYNYSVDYKPRSQTNASDRAARKYVEGSFSFALLGAIDTVEINGTIEI